MEILAKITNYHVSLSFPDLFLSAQQEYILLKLIYVYHYILNISYETRLIQSERTNGIKSTLQS